MNLCPAMTIARRLVKLVLCLCLGGRLWAATNGPTLYFDYGTGSHPANPLVKFMYFVPLVSKEPVFVYTNAGNTQCARVISFNCRTNGAVFKATCEFEMTGTGVQRNVFDHAELIRRREKDLAAGKLLAHQLASINVEGAGCGSVEVAGLLTNGLPIVTEVRLCFDGRGHASPVSINLQDLAFNQGAVQTKNEMVARVNELTFHEKAGRPEMEVALASVKSKDAGNGLWQNLLGGLKGMAATLFLPPLSVSADGHQAMMDFGLALVMGKAAFTFPAASRLQGSATITP